MQNSTLQRLKAASSRAALAAILEIEHKDLTYLFYAKQEADRYTSFSIPKKRGGLRVINAPIPQIKSLQRKLADKFEECLDEITKTSVGKRNPASHGFRPGKSILTNASVHRNRRYVFNIDLKDFFPTVTGKRIRGFLIKDRDFGLHKDVATIIAHIACFDNRLPQGSPCSPVISNLIAGILDLHLSRLAKSWGCSYTRYADDITFSTNQKDFPSEIAYCDANDPHSWTIGIQLSGLINKAGFELNPLKTRMQYRTSRQEVTGLVVNKKVNVTTEYRKLVRAYLFALINDGKFTLKKPVKGDDGRFTLEEVEGSRNQLHGMLGHIHSVDSVFRTDVKKNPYNYIGHTVDEQKPVANLALYRRFLFYTRFYSPDFPLIVCEGKTDGVYISNAVHQCKDMFPSLVRKNDEGKDVLSFQFLKYARKHKKKGQIYLPNFSTATILGCSSGGDGNLAKLLEGYFKDRVKFRAPMGKYPVIFIVDNDKGGRTVFSKVGGLFKKQITGNEPFVRVFANLYIVPLPKKKDSEDCSIEDLFSAADIQKGLDGKPFNFSNKDVDRTQFADKANFAYDFVAKEALNLNWHGFHPLLQNICAVFNDYRKSFEDT